MGLAFTQDAHASIADGSLTVTFRAWTRPQVKVGGRYRIGATTVEVTALAPVAASTVPATARARLDGAETSSTTRPRGSGPRSRKGWTPASW